MRSRKTYYTDYVRRALAWYFLDPDRREFESRPDELNYFACHYAVANLSVEERRAAESVYKEHVAATDYECRVCRRLEREVARLRELI